MPHPIPSSVPEVYRDFLAFLSVNALKSLPREKLLLLSFKTAVQSVKADQVAGSISKIDGVLKRLQFQDRVVWVTSPPAPIQWNSLDPSTRQIIGERILLVYFVLIRQEVPLFLDLRPENFGWDETSRRLLWRPSKLFFNPTPEFKTGLSALYRGFFESDLAASELGQNLYSWEQTLDRAQLDEINQVMLEHFGEARTRPVRFRMAHFSSTFHKVFDALSRSGARLHPELALVGMALCGLYQTLDPIPEELDAARAYAEASR